ncbi:AMP-dependent synthetase/ligase [Clohesyomyces aquaticus]|uniref:AMP-dependent synthetase/ligase n=1 Tax=Clohesyomyces aquaticus TaxID=1231657 RepID=A0A1Y2A5Z8_9PLEO|nr:AMP-dependent synthetase/ligase [Clohesyomyces aquaticus]
MPTSRQCLGYSSLRRSFGIHGARFARQCNFGNSKDTALQNSGDIRYFILAVAAVNTGRKMLFVSSKNSLEVHLAVLESGNCNTWVLTASDGNPQAIIDSRPMHTIDMLTLEEILQREPAEIYRYSKSFEGGKVDPCWILHTSGSTGLPKSVVRYMSSTSNTEAHLLCPLVKGKSLLIDELINSRVYLTFPLYYSASLSKALMWTIFAHQTLLLGSQASITSSVLHGMFQHARVDCLVTVLSTVEDIAQNEDTLNALFRVKAVAFGGGPLSQEIGDIICEQTKLILYMGATEAGWLTCVDTDRED